jgi:Do/DeqQ family serine protease
MKKLISIFFIVSLGGLIPLNACKQTSKNQFENFNSQKVSISDSNSKNISNSLNTGPDFTVAAEMTVHAVVHIRTEYKQKSSVYDDFFGSDPFFDDFFGRKSYSGTPQPIRASGSGVIVSKDGYIVTNNHVVQDADKIEVTLNDKRTFDARIIGTDSGTDLSLIKIDAHNLPSIIYGNSNDVKVGEWVLAVGNPFNLTSTVTAGIVSAKTRDINVLGGGTSIKSFIQTDAAINPGNSGGALVNIKGELIGINAAIATNTGSYTGYSFAIPVNIVKKIVNDMLNYGEVQRAFIGASVVNIDSKFAKEKELNKIKGVYVSALVENGSAEQAGIKKGDVITKINNVEVNSPSELLGIIGEHSPKDKIFITVERQGQEKVFSVILRNKYGNTKIVKKEENDVVSILGATFEPASKDEMRRLGIRQGLKITKIGEGKLWQAGIKKGFVITYIDKNPIRTVDDLKNILKYKKGGALIEGVYSNGIRAYYGFGM